MAMFYTAWWEKPKLTTHNEQQVRSALAEWLFFYRESTPHTIYHVLLSPCCSDIKGVSVHHDITAGCGYRCNTAHFCPNPTTTPISDAGCGQRCNTFQTLNQTRQWNTDFQGWIFSKFQLNHSRTPCPTLTCVFHPIKMFRYRFHVHARWKWGIERSC